MRLLKREGIALLPLFIVEEALQQGALIQILPNYSPPPLTISALYPQHRQHSAVTKIYCHFLQRESPEL